MSQIYRILLVDDDEVDTYLTQSMLQELGVAKKVEVCKNGMEALDYIRKVSSTKEEEIIEPELILLDIKMPIMDGFEFLKEIQEVNHQPFLIVIVSSSEHVSDLQKAAEYKVDYYITKPLTPDKLKKMWQRMYEE